MPVEFDALHDRRAHQGRRGPARACRSTWAAAGSLRTMAGSGGVVVFDDTHRRGRAVRAHHAASTPTSRAASARRAARAPAGWRGSARRLARRARAGRATSSCSPRRQRHRRQHDLRARRGGGLADAGVPHQVPRRLRGQAEEPAKAPARDRAPASGGVRRAAGVASNADEVVAGAARSLEPVRCSGVLAAFVTRLRDRRPSPARNPVTAVMCAGRRPSSAWPRIYAHAVRALPGGHPGAGLRRRHHGAVRLRGHDPEPRGEPRRCRSARRGSLRAWSAWLYLLADRAAWSSSGVAACRPRSAPPRRGRRRRSARSPPIGERAVPRVPVPVRGDLAAAPGRGRRRRRGVALAPQGGGDGARRRVPQRRPRSREPD